MTDNPPTSPAATLWIIEPHDPMIVRDGRPFNLTPGVRAQSQPFPPPSVVAGGIRTRAGMDERGGFTASPEDVKAIHIRGPFLVALKAGTNTPHYYAPAPADALLFEENNGDDMPLKRLRPLPRPVGMQSDFTALEFVGLPTPDPRKPSKKPPRFWHWTYFEQWLIHGTVDTSSSTLKSGVHTGDRQDVGNTAPAFAVSKLGIAGPSLDLRSHVSIESDRQTADEGMLFQTRGLEFTHTPSTDSGGSRLQHAERLALAVYADYSTSTKKPPVDKTTLVAPLGGERRLAHWTSNPGLNLPACPDKLAALITQDQRCRILLLTPAIWEHGFRPKCVTLLKHIASLSIELRAIAIHRAQIISGWDVELRKPKPTRRLAPAGTVLFITLKGSTEAIKQWVTSTWMTCISDDEQDCRDGFGLVALGRWIEQDEPQPEGAQQ